MYRYTRVASGLAHKATLFLECVELDPSFVHTKLEDHLWCGFWGTGFGRQDLSLEPRIYGFG